MDSMQLPMNILIRWDRVHSHLFLHMQKLQLKISVFGLSVLLAMEVVLLSMPTLPQSGAGWQATSLLEISVTQITLHQVRYWHYHHVLPMYFPCTSHVLPLFPCRSLECDVPEIPEEHMHLKHSIPNVITAPGGPPALVPLNTPTARATADLTAPSISVQTSRQSPQVAGKAAGSGSTTTSTKGSGGKQTPAGNHRSQTKVNAYFPSVDGNSRDSECSGPSAAERAAAAAVVALQGSGPMLSNNGANLPNHLQAQLPSSLTMNRLSPVAEVLQDERLAVCQQQLEAREEELRALKEQLRFVPCRIL
jgi:hypothetical protein